LVRRLTVLTRLGLWAALVLVVGVALLMPTAGAVPRVAGGRPASIGALPATAALVQRGVPARNGLFCGASVIAPDAVLTAAHCVTGMRASRLTVVTGRTRLSSEDSGQRTGVSRITIDPRWSAASTVNDFAVLRLSRPVSSLPLALARGRDAAGARVTVSGWGLQASGGRVSDGLRKAPLIVRSTASCRATYGRRFRVSVMLCASGAAEQGACDGDSGGPLTRTGSDGIERQIGVVSFGAATCDSRAAPGVYARVSGRASWIATTAGLGALGAR